MPGAIRGRPQRFRRCGRADPSRPRSARDLGRTATSDLLEESTLRVHDPRGSSKAARPVILDRTHAPADGSSTAGQPIYEAATAPPRSPGARFSILGILPPGTGLSSRVSPRQSDHLRGDRGSDGVFPTPRRRGRFRTDFSGTAVTNAGRTSESGHRTNRWGGRGPVAGRSPRRTRRRRASRKGRPKRRAAGWQSASHAGAGFRCPSDSRCSRIWVGDAPGLGVVPTVNHRQPNWSVHRTPAFGRKPEAPGTSANAEPVTCAG